MCFVCFLQIVTTFCCPCQIQWGYCTLAPSKCHACAITVNFRTMPSLTNRIIETFFFRNFFFFFAAPRIPFIWWSLRCHLSFNKNTDSHLKSHKMVSIEIEWTIDWSIEKMGRAQEQGAQCSCTDRVLEETNEKKKNQQNQQNIFRCATHSINERCHKPTSVFFLR